MRRNHDPGQADFRSRHQQLNALAWLLDSSIRLPGGFRIGIDALIGLLPGIGDLAGVLLSAWVMRLAASLGAPPSLLARMGVNVAVEGVVGMIPLLGDVFDAAWKANMRNARLLERYLANPAAATRSNRVVVGILLFLLVAFMATMSLLSALALAWIWNAVR